MDPQPRTLTGKLVEAYAARRLERALSKQAIFTQYLNRVYYGRLAYGIEAASRRFFGKGATELTLDEAALLACLPRAPTAYDPDRHPERVLRRRRHVLTHMAKRGWISHESAQRAADMPLVLAPRGRERRAPHLLDHLATRGALSSAGARVVVNIDVTLQEQLEQQVRMHLAELANRGAGAEQAGIVVLDNRSGEVLAMVGSRRYGEEAVAGAVNVTTALRPPGSTLKPFVYALALEDGAHPSTPVLDVPTHYLGYQPRGLHLRYHGAVPTREALGSSLNVPAVREAERLGPRRIARLLHDAGLRSVDPREELGLSIALGGVSVPLLELANAYATLARGGLYRPVRWVRRDAMSPGERVLSAETAFMITDSLADESARRREFGIETPLALGFRVAAKTGTSQAYGDNVVVGYTPAVTVAVWVGNFDGTPMHGLLAMEGAAPLWRSAMQLSHAGRAVERFVRPEGVTRMMICAEDGLAARGRSCARKRLEWVCAGW